MAFRPYVFQVSLFEAWIVVLSLSVGFLFIFGLGVYVGKEIQAYKTAQHSRAVRFPVTAAKRGKDATHPSVASQAGAKRLPRSTRPEEATPSPTNTAWSDTHQSVVPEKQSAPPRHEGTLDGAFPTIREKQPSARIGLHTDSRQDWNIQVLVTSKEDRARAHATELQQQGYTPSIQRFVKDGEVLYRLRVGGFSKEQARQVADRFKQEGTFGQAYLVTD